MKNLACLLIVTVFCGASRLLWADAAGDANQVNPQPLPPGQEQQVTRGHTGKDKAALETNSSGNGKYLNNKASGIQPTHHDKNQINKLNPNKGNFDQSSRLMENEGIFYYYKHSDGHHTLTGPGNNGALTTGAKVPKSGKEVIVNFEEGDPDKPVITGKIYNAEKEPSYHGPVVTGQGHNGAATTSGSHFSKAQLQARKAGKEGTTNVKSFGSATGGSQKPVTFTGGIGGNAALGNHSTQPIAR